MKRWLLGWVAAGLTVSSAAYAQGDEVQWPTQAFFLNDVAQVQKPAEVQTQLGLRFRDEGAGSELETPLSAEVGVAPRLQLSAELPWQRQNDAGDISRGVGNLTVASDYGLESSQSAGLAMTVGVAVETPTGKDEVTDTGLAIRPRFRVFKRVGVLGLNATVSPALERTKDTSWIPGGELGAAMSVGNGLFVPTVEARGELGAEKGAEAGAGLRFVHGETFELGAAVLAGVRNGDPLIGGATNLLVDLGG